MNNKNYFIFAAAIALASCSVDEYMGENPEFTQTTKENIIGFGGGTGSMSRATQNTGTTEQMLDKHFKVYGCKLTTTPGTYQVVFDNYWVWYDTNTSTSTSNSYSWEYVDNSGTQIYGNDLNSPVGQLKNDQYIKYWDYSADHYHFVAGSPYDSFTFNTNLTTKEIESANVTGLAGHIDPNSTNTAMTTNPVYIAKPVAISKISNSYGNAVKFDFVRQQSMVRVGIYETIPGYSISSIKFYKYDTSSNKLIAETENQNNVVLTLIDANFYGGTSITATVNYDWTTSSTPSYSYIVTGATAMNNWYGGKFNGIQAASSNDTDISKLYGEDGDMNNKGYFTVIPNNNDKAIIIKCDYTLTSNDGSNETINVKGATAAIPAAYCKWEPNKMYTYIFKISQETNGTTGDPNNPEDKPGLFPITFDAVATAEENTTLGYETIINTPSITTYQAGSVTDNGIEYKAGTAIYITVTDDNGTLKSDLQNNTTNSAGYINVYKVDNGTTEADLTVNAPSTSTVTVNLDKLNATDTDKTKATFTPEDAGYYAIQYCYKVESGTPVYKYKVIYVKDASSSEN